MLAAGRSRCYTAAAILALATATIAGAWIVEAAGFAPCELCLVQRWPYYAGIPVAALTLALAWRGGGRLLTAAFAVLVLLFGTSAILGAFHAGVEWGFWPGPTACTGALVPAASFEDFLAQLENVPVVRCDAPAFRILGLSLAGWNVLVSGALASLAGLVAWLHGSGRAWAR
jgi:disulfide bond formation protein DsbB